MDYGKIAIKYSSNFLYNMITYKLPESPAQIILKKLLMEIIKNKTIVLMIMLFL